MGPAAQPLPPGRLIPPLCLEPWPAESFFSRLPRKHSLGQAAGAKATVSARLAHQSRLPGAKMHTRHAKNHIFEKVNPAMEALGMECKCLGGGKIEHNSQEKKLRVFGESTAFGKADHSVSAEKLKSAFSDYEITWSDDKK
ncbi:hypothetical protein KUCAC02_023066 [Chaenocephalus aceratus]|uniref:Uncharacterized protein n=1 Tax=Chaenocephalus aceratus TaxID=36190 RepID=A0ACB9XQE2_CHAAC|nr:hypothetical protein KUCAC02_023066 [Chaenocephalus aceratus]